MEFPSPPHKVVAAPGVIHQPKPLRPLSDFKILVQRDDEAQPGDEPQSRDDSQPRDGFPPNPWSLAPVTGPHHRDEHADTCAWRATTPPVPCRITDLGHAIYAGNASTMRSVLRNGSSPNHPCHRLGFFKAEYPLHLVTSRKYHERTDECFLVLVGAGVDIEYQAMDKKDLIDLVDQLFVFAFRPMASLHALRAVLGMKIDFTEQRRERLRELANNRCWYHGDIVGKEIWTLQNDQLQLQRRRIVSSRFLREEIIRVSSDPQRREAR